MAENLALRQQLAVFKPQHCRPKLRPADRIFWLLLRRPADSVASLSAANVRNPTFTHDVADLYVFRLQATNAAKAICIRTLAFTATPAPPRILEALLVWTNGQFSLPLQSQAGSAVEIQASTNLVDWTSVATLTNEAGTMPFTDTDNTFTGRFYRLHQLP
jgi:hypothetical protein